MGSGLKERRGFIKMLAVLFGAFPLIGNIFAPVFALAKAKDIPLPEGMAEVPESDQIRNAIGYKKNVEEIDFTKYPNRKKPEAKNQFCNNCQLYTKVNDGWGKCQMMQTGVVAAKGWCASWSKKEKKS